MYRDVDVSCSSASYVLWLILFAVPSFFVYAIMIPGVLLCLLVKNRDDLHREAENLEALRMYGFLTLGYERELFFWPVVELFRKTTFTTVVFIQHNTMVQSVIALAVLLYGLLLHTRFLPFESSTVDACEFMALSSSSQVLLLGILLTSESISENQNELIAIPLLLTILANVLVVFWGLYEVKFWVTGKTEVGTSNEVATSKDLTLGNEDDYDGQNQGVVQVHWCATLQAPAAVPCKDECELSDISSSESIDVSTGYKLNIERRALEQSKVGASALADSSKISWVNC